MLPGLVGRAWWGGGRDLLGTEKPMLLPLENGLTGVPFFHFFLKNERGRSSEDWVLSHQGCCLLLAPTLPTPWPALCS